MHEKLQNFMVPVPVNGTWHEEQIDELFSSLLGKGFERSARDDPSSGEVDAVLADSVKSGFKIFG